MNANKVRELWADQLRRPFPYRGDVPNAELAALDSEVAGIIQSLLDVGYNRSGSMPGVQLRDLRRRLLDARPLLEEPEDRYLDGWIALVDAMLESAEFQ